MKLLALSILWAALWTSSGISSAYPQTVKPVKVLFLVGGLYHDYDQLPATLIANLQARLKSVAPIEFTITQDLASLRTESLTKYDALMINVCEQTALTTDERGGLANAIQSGLPLVAMHCTFWSFQDWPEFKQILGAFVPGHDRFATFCLRTVAADSPILKGVQPSFDLTDEPYLVNDRDPSMNVLVRTCTNLPNRPDPEPEVWTKMYGKGRIFAITFGHDSRAQSDPNYQALLANGLLWSLDRSR
jgi:type 1 glutamine amidotransferase